MEDGFSTRNGTNAITNGTSFFILNLLAVGRSGNPLFELIEKLNIRFLLPQE